jgi:hypothetical protein
LVELKAHWKVQLMVQSLIKMTAERMEKYWMEEGGAEI